MITAVVSVGRRFFSLLNSHNQLLLGQLEPVSFADTPILFCMYPFCLDNHAAHNNVEDQFGSSRQVVVELWARRLQPCIGLKLIYEEIIAVAKQKSHNQSSLLR